MMLFLTILFKCTLITFFSVNSEVNSGFFYKTAEERVKLVKAERQFIENRVQKVIDLKKKLCDGTDKTFVIINQKVLIKNLKTSQSCRGSLHIVL